jgi:hypothetical protein
MPFMIFLEQDQLIPNHAVLGFVDGMLIGMGGIDIQLNERSDLSLGLFLFHFSSPLCKSLWPEFGKMKTE